MLADCRVGQSKHNRPALQLGLEDGDVALVVDGNDGGGMAHAVFSHNFDLCGAGNDMRRRHEMIAAVTGSNENAGSGRGSARRGAEAGAVISRPCRFDDHHRRRRRRPGGGTVVGARHVRQQSTGQNRHHRDARQDPAVGSGDGHPVSGWFRPHPTGGRPGRT